MTELCNLDAEDVIIGGICGGIDVDSIQAIETTGPMIQDPAIVSYTTPGLIIGGTNSVVGHIVGCNGNSITAGTECSIIGGSNCWIKGDRHNVIMLNCVDCTAETSRVTLVGCKDLIVSEPGGLYIGNRNVAKDVADIKDAVECLKRDPFYFIKREKAATVIQRWWRYCHYFWLGRDHFMSVT